MESFEAAIQTMVLHRGIDENGIYDAARKAKDIG